MAAVWPAAVPWKPMMPFTMRGPVGAFAVTNFEKGPAQRRRVTSAGTSTVDVTLPVLNRAQTAALLQWHYTVLGEGTMAFEVEDPMTGLLRMWTFATPIDVEMLTDNIRRATFTLDLLPGLT